MLPITQYSLLNSINKHPEFNYSVILYAVHGGGEGLAFRPLVQIILSNCVCLRHPVYRVRWRFLIAYFYWTHVSHFCPWRRYYLSFSVRSLKVSRGKQTYVIRNIGLQWVCVLSAATMSKQTTMADSVWYNENSIWNFLVCLSSCLSLSDFFLSVSAHFNIVEYSSSARKNNIHAGKAKSVFG